MDEEWEETLPKLLFQGILCREDECLLPYGNELCKFVDHKIEDLMLDRRNIKRMSSGYLVTKEYMDKLCIKMLDYFNAVLKESGWTEPRIVALNNRVKFRLSLLKNRDL